MAARPLVAFLSLFFTAGAILLLFFIILAGGHNSSPLNQFYFLQADTSKIPGAPPVSRWTMYTVCGVNSHGRNANCMSRKPAYPLNPPENFHTKTGVPQSFIGTHRYYYETRFMFAFFLITLFFAVCSIFTGILAMFSRLGGYVSGVFASIAAFFAVISAALMSAAYVAGRNHFHSNGQSAKVGTKLFAFAWTSFVLLFLSTILFFVTGGISHRSEQPTYTKKTGGKSFFSRKRSTRSRGSFIDNESQRRVVKDEYS